MALGVLVPAVRVISASRGTVSSLAFVIKKCLLAAASYGVSNSGFISWLLSSTLHNPLEGRVNGSNRGGSGDVSAVGLLRSGRDGLVVVAASNAVFLGLPVSLEVTGDGGNNEAQLYCSDEGALTKSLNLCKLSLLVSSPSCPLPLAPPAVFCDNLTTGDRGLAGPLFGDLNPLFGMRGGAIKLRPNSGGEGMASSSLRAARALSRLSGR